MTKPKKDEQAKASFTLYIPYDILQGVKADAEKNFRSANSHVVWILDQYLKKQK